jgi:hypothetical protein
MEQLADTFAIVAAANDLAQHGADVDDLNLGARGLVGGLGEGVCNDELLEAAFGEGGEGVAAENAVRDDRADLGGASLGEVRCGENEGSTGVRDIIYQKRGLAGYVAHEYHAGDLVGLFALFVEQSKVDAETVCNGGGPASAKDM